MGKCRTQGRWPFNRLCSSSLQPGADLLNIEDQLVVEKWVRLAWHSLANRFADRVVARRVIEFLFEPSPQTRSISQSLGESISAHATPPCSNVASMFPCVQHYFTIKYGSVSCATISQLVESGMRSPSKREPGIPHRLQHLVELAGSAGSLAELTGVSKRSLNDWLNSVRPPHPTLLIKICQATGASLSWLRNGEGDAPSDIAAHVPASSKKKNVPSAGEFIKLTSLETQPIQSIGSVSRVWAQLHLGLAPGQLLFLTALDDAMTPAIERNEPVLAQLIPPEDRITLAPDPHGIYVVQIEDQLLLRRVKPGKEPQSWLADRDNYQIRSFGSSRGVPIQLHQILGQAVWTGRRLLSTPTQ